MAAVDVQAMVEEMDEVKRAARRGLVELAEARVVAASVDVRATVAEEALRAAAVMAREVEVMEVA